MTKDRADYWLQKGKAFHIIRDRTITFSNSIEVTSMFNDGKEWALCVLGLGGVIVDDTILLDFNPNI